MACFNTPPGSSRGASIEGRFRPSSLSSPALRGAPPHTHPFRPDHQQFPFHCLPPPKDRPRSIQQSPGYTRCANHIAPPQKNKQRQRKQHPRASTTEDTNQPAEAANYQKQHLQTQHNDQTSISTKEKAEGKKLFEYIPWFFYTTLATTTLLGCSMLPDCGNAQFGIIPARATLALFDFTSAFNSFHCWFFAILNCSETLWFLLNSVRALYFFNFTVTHANGEVILLFLVMFGVLQGCPMSAFLFDLALDPILNAMQACLPDIVL